MNTKIIEGLRWRYATKKFDPSKKISVKHLEILKESVYLSASSYGLQPYKVLILKNPILREQLKPVSWGQSQITDASHLFIFCNFLEIGDKDVDALLIMKAKVQQLNLSDLQGPANFMKAKLSEKPKEERADWAARQAYIALGILLATCGELKIDSCPIEGFSPEEYDRILNLKNFGLTASVVTAIGYRAEDDKNQFSPKVRKHIDEIFENR